MTGVLINGLAELQAFYLYRVEDAISLLMDVIDHSNVNKELKAQSKLLLGDILLFNGEVWDAKLYYSQVEKEFKYDVLGQDAKFRNAKLSYYIGEFEWAKAQLDVLKAATSKLIANDALYLSLLISDNTVMDSTSTALLMFARADMFVYQNKQIRPWLCSILFQRNFPTIR